jgi:serpin B
MPHPALALVLRHLRRGTRPPGADGPTDGQLLERYAAQRDEAAFEMLLHRHGRMVWNVCHRVLANSSDADDAFQATFLVLVRKARSIAKRDSVGSWLHGVAYRIALDARAGAARRRTHESRRATPVSAEPPTDSVWSDVRQVLDEELGRLPEKYRAPLVLCYLEGKTNDEAAGLLGWTRGTIAGRLARARDLLRTRLTRRGLTLTSAALGGVLAHNAASAAVPAVLLNLTLKGLLGDAPASAVTLAEGALRTMSMTRLKLAAGLMALLVLTGTGAGWLLHQARAKPPVPDLAEAPEAPRQGARAEAGEAPRRAARAEKPADAKADRAALVKGNSAFAWDLYAKLRAQKGNVVYSPYSISTALAMTYAGARGKTAEAMAKVLHFTLPGERLHPAAGALVRDLGGPTSGKKRPYQLHVANALWGQKGYGFRKDFLSLTRTNYGAGLREVDFVRAREETRKTINAWVEKQTKDKIKELLKAAHLRPDTRLVLTNAIYFKGLWQEKFDKKATRDAPFHLTAKRKVKVPTMYKVAMFRYATGGSFQMLDLPFAGKDMSMLVLLPKKVDGLAALEKEMTAESLSRCQKNLRYIEVKVLLPRFKVTGAFDLKDTLTALGMGLPFDRRSADFSGLTESRERFWISQVAHKAFVDVNEEGAEAAGATGVGLVPGGIAPRAVTFRADHPFVFVLRDNRSGSVLFVGRVADPRKESAGDL